MPSTTVMMSCKLLSLPFLGLMADDARTAACEAWLGVGFQITAARNSVNRGNVQDIHRDYRE